MSRIAPQLLCFVLCLVSALAAENSTGPGVVVCTTGFMPLTQCVPGESQFSGSVGSLHSLHGKPPQEPLSCRSTLLSRHMDPVVFLCRYEVELFRGAASVLGRSGSAAEWLEEGAPGNWSFYCFADWEEMWVRAPASDLLLPRPWACMHGDTCMQPLLRDATSPMHAAFVKPKAYHSSPAGCMTC